MAGGMVFRFGPFEFDSVSGRLFRGSTRLPLSHSQSAILERLLTSAGGVVSREALIETAWGNTAVSDDSLAQAIRRLREALGTGGDSTVYIETVNNEGYQFVASLERARCDAAPISLDAQLAPYRAFVQGRAELDTLDAAAIQRARIGLEEVVRVAPGYADAHVGLAMACALTFEATTVEGYADIATLQSGIESARRGCALAVASGDAWSTLAFVLYLSGDSHEASAAVCRASELDPENSRHGLRLARASWGDHRLKSARRVLTLAPGLALAHWLRATVFIARGNFASVEEELRLGCAAQDVQSKGAHLPAVGLHLLNGLVHAAHDRLEDATAALMRELDFADSGQLYARECAANTWYALGAIRLRQALATNPAASHGAEAEHALTRALTIAPGHAAAHAALSGQVLPSATPVDAAIARLDRAGSGRTPPGGGRCLSRCRGERAAWTCRLAAAGRTPAQSAGTSRDLGRRAGARPASRHVTAGQIIHISVKIPAARGRTLCRRR